MKGLSIDPQTPRHTHATTRTSRFTEGARGLGKKSTERCIRKALADEYQAMTKLLAVDHERLEDDVARAANGDPHALRRATGVLLPVLGRHLHRFRLPPEDHHDVLQNSLSRIHQRLADYRGDARFVTWASRVASNEALMHLRTERRRRRRVTTTDAELDVVSHEETEEPFDGAGLRAVLEELPVRYQEVLRARYADERPLAVIANDLRTSESSVRCSLARGRNLLRSRLKKAGISSFAEARASL